MEPGTLFFYRNFKFQDGEKKDKIIIVLGSLKGIVLVVKTTSQGRRFLLEYGCQVNHRFPNFHLVKNSCCLPKPTWVVLDDFYELKNAELLERHFAGDICRIGKLSEELTVDLIECAIQSEDITPFQVNIIRT